MDVDARSRPFELVGLEVEAGLPRRLSWRIPCVRDPAKYFGSGMRTLRQ